MFIFYTLSGRIGKMVASHAEVALIYTMHVVLRGIAHEGGGVLPVNWIYRL